MWGSQGHEAEQQEKVGNDVVFNLMYKEKEKPSPRAASTVEHLSLARGKEPWSELHATTC